MNNKKKYYQGEITFLFKVDQNNFQTLKTPETSDKQKIDKLKEMLYNAFFDEKLCSFETNEGDVSIDMKQVVMFQFWIEEVEL